MKGGEMVAVYRSIDRASEICCTYCGNVFSSDHSGGYHGGVVDVWVHIKDGVAPICSIDCLLGYLDRINSSELDWCNSSECGSFLGTPSGCVHYLRTLFFDSPDREGNEQYFLGRGRLADSDEEKLAQERFFAEYDAASLAKRLFPITGVYDCCSQSYFCSIDCVKDYVACCSGWKPISATTVIVRLKGYIPV